MYEEEDGKKIKRVVEPEEVGAPTKSEALTESQLIQ